ncbi:MAG TPA: Mrp/NBP35 family ATP-binding protein [Bacilli bacterium]|nr:Mrp/NBP35 family ATP-binding protein [Bacilli bacterium]HPS18638.1 Mrp/NBP35 family ATP-binding protein [Bacilli bacterium]
MSECNHDCEHCASNDSCETKSLKAKLNELSHIKRIIGILSGKGGVGKSYVTSLLAVSLIKRGFKVGILDADVTGPSIPKAFNIGEKAAGENSLIYPLSSRLGIKIISANCLLEDDSDPIIWRGPLLANLVKQFYEDVLWEELDYLLIDMPPGTGDVALTIFQSIPVDDLIIVTSPQDLVSLIVTKAIKMAEMMHINVLGVIENMSYLTCPDCGKKIEVFGTSHLDSFAKQLHFNILGRLPLNSQNASLVDEGRVEEIALPEIEEVTNKILTKEN